MPRFAGVRITPWAVFQSVAKDARFAKIRAIPLRTRAWLLIVKYAALGGAVLGTSFRRFRFLGRDFYFTDPLDPAFLENVFVESHDYLAQLGLLGRRGLCLVDVGAHNGETALAWSVFLPDSRIQSFEPHPGAYANAVRNLAGYPVRLSQAGLGDERATLPFDTSGRLGSTTFLMAASGRDAVDVEVFVGDDVIDFPRVDLLKIDVEGYELHVLRGLDSVLARTRWLALELSLARDKDHRFHEVAGILARHTFTLVRASAPHRADDSQTAIDLYLCREKT